jgi:hypothetical protein
MAVLAWFEKDLPGHDRAAKVAECDEWLTKTSKWESYVLDARMGIKITTSIGTLRHYQAKHI